MLPFVISLILVGQPVEYTGLIWIHSESCVPCKEMQPSVEKLIAEGKPIIIVLVKTQEELKKYNSEYVPTTIAFIKGKEINRIVGKTDITSLMDLIYQTEKK